MVLATMKRSNEQESPCPRRTQVRYSDICVETNSDSKKPKTPFSFKPFVFHELQSNSIYPSNRARVPEPRSGHRIVCDDANFFSFGGYLEINAGISQVGNGIIGQPERHMQRLFEELWCYNYAEAQWKYLPTIGKAPKELASHSAVLYGNYLIVFGGTGVPFGGSSSNKMNICDLRTLTWQSIETTGEPPSPQYGQAVVLDREKRNFYVIGGTTGYDYSMDIHKLDLTKREWEKIFVSRGDSSEPQPRYRHEVAFDGKYIYILGGGTAREAYDLKTIPAFDVQTTEWSMQKTKGSPTNPKFSNPRYPCPRKCQGSVQRGDDVFICGGYDSKTIFLDLWKLNIPTMQWQFMPVKMPIPLYFHSTTITNAGCMYIFGGVTQIKNNVRTNRIFKIWLTVPKLKEICWEALLHYRNDINRHSRSHLMRTGIPIEFANRVHPSPPGGQPDPSVKKNWTSDRERYLQVMKNAIIFDRILREAAAHPRR